MTISPRAARPWHREPWPWLLAAGPLIVIVASMSTAWIAVKSNDGVVAEDYYTRGLAINRDQKQIAANRREALGATVRVADNGEVRARVQGATHPASELPKTIRLKLAHPVQSGDELVVLLTRDSSGDSVGDYRGMLPQQTPGRWIVTLESDAWRLPITTVPGRLTDIALGAAAGGS
jgi:uncharacterized protein